MNLIFATGNKDKMKEIREILKDVDFIDEIRSMAEAGLDPEIIEDGLTFEENALIKARTVHAAAKEAGMNVLVLADDSGLSIDCLNGEPGIYSARYMGKDTPYSEKNANLISRVDADPSGNRRAEFICAIAAVFPNGDEKVVRGTVEGEIARKPSGHNGFGFDPIFFLPDLGVTTADLEPQKKHALSHRGNALRLIRGVILEHENTCDK